VSDAASAPRQRGASQVALLIALGLGLVAWGIAARVYEALPHPAPFEELAYYPSGDHLGRMTLGHAETAADLAWLRAVQYYGEHSAGGYGSTGAFATRVPCAVEVAYGAAVV
jgi:hypothetical protein